MQKGGLLEPFFRIAMYDGPWPVQLARSRNDSSWPGLAIAHWSPDSNWVAVLACDQSNAKPVISTHGVRGSVPPDEKRALEMLAKDIARKYGWDGDAAVVLKWACSFEGEKAYSSRTSGER